MSPAPAILRRMLLSQHLTRHTITSARRVMVVERQMADGAGPGVDARIVPSRRMGRAACKLPVSTPRVPCARRRGNGARFSCGHRLSYCLERYLCSTPVNAVAACTFSRRTERRALMQASIPAVNGGLLSLDALEITFQPSMLLATEHIEPNHWRWHLDN